jgi:CRISPR/Cas system CSM-associated protein Csm3 (group 7 of RAMP superfamily)
MPRPARVPAADTVADGFANPYVFVPLPASPSPRAKFTSHAAFTGLSGVIDVGITTLSPLLIGGPRSQTGDQAAQIAPFELGGRYMIPATSIKGLLRSMVDVMTGSCLRTTDLTRQFSRRAFVESEALSRAFRVKEVVIPSPDTEESSSAKVVLEECDFYKLEIRTEDGSWVEANNLEGKKSGEVARVRLHGRNATIDRHGDREGFLKLSDVRGKDGAPGTLRRHQHVFMRKPNRRITIEGEAALALIHDHDAAWEQAIADEAKAHGNSGIVSCGEHHESISVAERKKWGTRRVRHRLSEGDLVWAAGAGESIERIDQSRIGRRRGRPVRIAVPESFIGRSAPQGEEDAVHDVDNGEPAENFAPQPSGGCRDANHLCWSCRLLGMVAPTAQENDLVASVSGHIRIGWAAGGTDSATRLLKLELPALSSPKPANGWYLAPSTYGRRADWVGDDLLEIAGSKLYLHRGDVPSRHEDQHDNQAADVEALPTGTRFTFAVRFDNLTEAQVGSLLAALDPRLLAGPLQEKRFEAAALKVGMGKPVGLGSVQVSKLSVDLIDRAGRYSSLTDDAVTRALPEDLEGYVTAFVAEMSGAGVTGHWKALAAALDLELGRSVAAHYPKGPRGKEHESFEWFGRHRTAALPQPEQLAEGQRLQR